MQTNKQTIPALMADAWDSTEAAAGKDKYLFLCSGPMPDFKATFVDSIKSLTHYNMVPLFNGEVPSVIAKVSVTGSIWPKFDAYGRCVVPLSELTVEPFQVIEAGTPTWFFFAFDGYAHADNNFHTWTGVRYWIAGTVGDKDSGADLQIVGGIIEEGGTYLVPDLVLYA